MKWIEIKEGDNSTLPKEGEEYLFDGSETEQAPVYARVKYNGKHPCLVVLDSSGEEEYYPISDYYRWLDQSDGWISCEDRLPEFGIEVLVRGESKGSNPQMGGAYIVIAKRQDLRGTQLGNNSLRYQDEHQFSNMAYTIHWQPLPAAPLVNNLNK